MRGRVVRLLVVAGMVAALVAVQGAQVASGDESDGPVGYTIGSSRTTGAAILGCNFYKIDLETGEATQVNAVGQPVACGDGLTFDDDGTLYAFRNTATGGPATPTELITIDKHTGVQHVVGPLPQMFVGAAGMTFDADGHLWLYGSTFGEPSCGPDGTTCLWKVNPDNAHATLVGAAPLGRGVYGLAGDCEDVLAITAGLLAGPGSSQTQLAEVDTGNASLHKIADAPGVGFPTGLDFDGDDDLWALGIAGGGTPAGAGIGMTVYKIDPNNGNSGGRDITINGVPFPGIMEGLAVSAISCDDPGPEPTPTPAPVIAAEPLFTG